MSFVFADSSVHVNKIFTSKVNVYIIIVKV